MHKQFAVVVAALLCGCTHPSPEPVAPPRPASPEPVAEAPASPADLGGEPGATGLTPCPKGAARALLDDCLGGVPPGGSFVVVEEPKPAFGYVCAFFARRGGPRCSEGAVEVIRRWRDDSDPECPKTLTVYWAPYDGSPPVEEQDVPGSHLRMRSFPSDGTQFSFIRLDDHMAEATSCLDAAQQMQAALVAWSAQLMTEDLPSGV